MDLTVLPLIAAAAVGVAALIVLLVRRWPRIEPVLLSWQFDALLAAVFVIGGLRHAIDDEWLFAICKSALAAAFAASALRAGRATTS